MGSRGRSQDSIDKQLKAILKNMLTKEHFDDEMSSIKTKLDEHEEKIKDMDERLEKVENGSTSASPDAVLTEIHDQDSRKKNVIIFKLPEHVSGNSKAQTYKKELKLITELCADMGIIDSVNDTINVRFSRLGKIPNPAKPRPMKVIFRYTAIREQVFIAVANLKGIERWKNISITPDLTKAQMQLSKTKRNALLQLAKTRNELRTEEDIASGVEFKVVGHYGHGNLRIHKFKRTVVIADEEEDEE